MENDESFGLLAAKTLIHLTNELIWFYEEVYDEIAQLFSEQVGLKLAYEDDVNASCQMCKTLLKKLKEKEVKIPTELSKSP